MNLRVKTPPGARPLAAGRSAASLVEMIAVLAIISLLAAALFPALIKRMDMATRAQEAANLVAIREALLLYVVRNATIPDHTTWQTAAADWSKLPVSQVATNACRYRRLYFLESGPNPASLPYAQSSAGTSRPANLRSIVVSILGGDPLTSSNCPDPDGGFLSDADFNALWNTPEGGRPTAGPWASWNGTGDDFLAQRIDYAPLFHHLVLVNRDAASPSFTLNGSSPVTVANNTNNNVGWDSYYLDGSVVDLCDTSGTTLTRHVLKGDISFVFEDGYWRAQIMGLTTGNYLADNLSDQAGAFLAAKWYSGAFKGADQQSALVAMYSFMYTYTLWANQSPHFPHHGVNDQQVPEFLMLQSVADSGKPLDRVTGTGGLLK